MNYAQGHGGKRRERLKRIYDFEIREYKELRKRPGTGIVADNSGKRDLHQNTM